MFSIVAIGGRSIFVYVLNECLFTGEKNLYRDPGDSLL